MKARRHQNSVSSSANTLSGKAATDPQPVRATNRARQLDGVERRQLDVFDTAGERFRRLPHEIDRGRSEEKEVSRPFAYSAAIVDDAAQSAEQLWRAMNFIDDYKFSSLPAQKRVGVRQPPLIDGSLQVGMHSLCVPFRQSVWRGLSFRLDAVGNSDCWHMPEPVLNVWPKASRDCVHARNLNVGR